MQLLECLGISGEFDGYFDLFRPLWECSLTNVCGGEMKKFCFLICCVLIAVNLQAQAPEFKLPGAEKLSVPEVEKPATPQFKENDLIGFTLEEGEAKIALQVLARRAEVQLLMSPKMRDSKQECRITFDKERTTWNMGLSQVKRDCDLSLEYTRGKHLVVAIDIEDLDFVMEIFNSQ